MSETRIVDIIEFVDKSSRVINLEIRLRISDNFTIWDSTFRKQTRCTTESWSSKQSSQDIIICTVSSTLVCHQPTKSWFCPSHSYVVVDSPGYNPPVTLISPRYPANFGPGGQPIASPSGSSVGCPDNLLRATSFCLGRQQIHNPSDIPW